MTGEIETERQALSGAGPPDPADDLRDLARKHIEKRRGLQASVLAYVVINAFLVGIWALSGGGYFWPVWVMAAWGVGLVFQVWDYLRRPVTEADVEAEVRRMHLK